MLRLDVVQLAFSGASEQVEQQIALVQISASKPEQLTGLQEHHFSAFYRAPWCVNDWLHGRMDGAAQIVRMLLDPDRLRQVNKQQEGTAGPGGLWARSINWQSARRVTPTTSGWNSNGRRP
jgi:hypothetical protein